MLFLDTTAAAPIVEEACEHVNGLDTLWVLLGAMLVFWMQPGFALVEAGMTRSKNTANILMKNFCDFMAGSVLYWLVGFSIMYGAGNAFAGWDGFCFIGSDSNVPAEATFIFLPYIQRHEFETLLFSNMDGFSAIDMDEKAMAQLQSIELEYANPEDINGGAETAPSKRLGHIFNYEKAADSFTMLSAIPIDTIRAKCPRFDRWVLQLEDGLRQGCFQ